MVKYFLWFVSFFWGDIIKFNVDPDKLKAVVEGETGNLKEEYEKGGEEVFDKWLLKTDFSNDIKKQNFKSMLVKKKKASKKKV